MLSAATEKRPPAATDLLSVLYSLDVPLTVKGQRICYAHDTEIGGRSERLSPFVLAQEEFLNSIIPDFTPATKFKDLEFKIDQFVEAMQFIHKNANLTANNFLKNPFEKPTYGNLRIEEQHLAIAVLNPMMEMGLNAQERKLHKTTKAQSAGMKAFETAGGVYLLMQPPGRLYKYEVSWLTLGKTEQEITQALLEYSNRRARSTSKFQWQRFNTPVIAHDFEGRVFPLRLARAVNGVTAFLFSDMSGELKYTTVIGPDRTKLDPSYLNPVGTLLYASFLLKDVEGCSNISKQLEKFAKEILGTGKQPNFILNDPVLQRRIREYLVKNNVFGMLLEPKNLVQKTGAQ